MLRLISHSVAETHALGERLGRLLQPGDVVTLSGEMGAGKTTLAQGLGRGLAISEPVCSPTFALVQQYAGRLPVWHLDVYRLGSRDELVDLGWSDLLASQSVLLIEWPERIEADLPPGRLEIRLEGVEETRTLEIHPYGASLQARFTSLLQELGQPGVEGGSR